MSYPSFQHLEHDHALAPIDNGRIFKCNGCNELGFGNHYMCTHPESNCNFHLHVACAEAHIKPPIKQALYGDRYLFAFGKKPVNNDKYCVACGKRISRYNYSCSGKNWDLHPNCTTEFPLERIVNFVPVELKKNINGKKCLCCQKSKYGGRRLDTWAYVSKSKSEEKQYFAGCLQDSQLRKYREGREMSEDSEPLLRHPEHDHVLAPIGKGRIFRCNGCHELGSENHYMCTHPESYCSFHLHIACAEAHIKPPIKQALYGDRYLFEFRKEPENNDKYCVACGKRIRRYNYSCSGADLSLHPNCTTEFPLEHRVNGIPVELKENINGKKCLCCDESKYGGRLLDTWAYVSKFKSEEKQYFAGCLQDSQMRKYREALRDGSGSSSQVTRSTSLDSKKGSTSGSPVNPKETPGLLYRILEPAATIANSITQGITIITGFPLSSP